MTHDSQASPSPSTTTPGTSKLRGQAGQIMLGDHVVASKADWTLKLSRETVDATVFGKSKTFLIPRPSVSGTFSGNLDVLEGSWVESDGAELVFHQYVRPAWWGRLKHAVLRSDWPTYEAVRGVADITSVRTPDGSVKGTYRFVGPAMIAMAPVSRLERLWARACHPSRWRS